MQTVVASLYSDKLTAEWGGREEGDDEQADNLNALSKYDYDQMEKDESDFMWIWRTCFYGRGLVELSEFKREPEKGIYIPIQKGIDNLTLLRDPNATSVNGTIGRSGAARFLGWEIRMSGLEIENNPHRVKGEDDFALKDINFGSDPKSLIRDADQARDVAQGRQTQRFKRESKMGINAQYDVLRWFTKYVEGGKVKKVKVWVANDRTKLIALQDLGECEETIWPIIDRSLYPTANDWDGTSIPDLTEDKQRARAVAQNLGLNAMKADLYPSYIYDSNRVVNKKDLKVGFNKFIPIDSKGRAITDAVLPLIKARPNMNLLDFIYTSLDASAQKATATPEIQQGAVSEERRTLGELNLVASKVDTRFSLSAKIFGWSEKRWWRQWYTLYKENFKDNIDEKVIRIVGAFGAKFRPLERSNIITDKDPDLVIESRVLSRARQLEDRQSMTNYLTLAFADPTVNRRYGLRKLARLNGMEKDEVDRLWPQTVDERIAEQQNDLLNDNKTAPVLAEDDHNVHLEMHSKANLTNATQVHLETHIQALSIKKVNPEFFPQPEQIEDTGFTPPGSANVTSQPALPPKAIAPSQTSGVGA